MFLGVGGLVALLVALFEFTLSYLAQVNTILILNYSYWKQTLYAITHTQFEGENYAIILHNWRAKMCVKNFSAFCKKLQTYVFAQNRSQNIYTLEQQSALEAYGLVSLAKFPVLVWHCEHVFDTNVILFNPVKAWVWLWSSIPSPPL